MLSKLVAPFSDITNDNHKEFIETLYEEGIFKEADKFNPKDTLKRYQFALMLNRALDLDVPATTNFTDIAKLDQETQDAVKALNITVDGIDDISEINVYGRIFKRLRYLIAMFHSYGHYDI